MHDHTIWEFARVAIVGVLAGAGGLRVVSSKIIRTMPKPLPGERWYAWLYDAAQDLCDNQELKGQRGEVQTSAKTTSN